jgi:hypothetical protein
METMTIAELEREVEVLRRDLIFELGNLSGLVAGLMDPQAAYERAQTSADELDEMFPGPVTDPNLAALADVRTNRLESLEAFMVDTEGEVAFALETVGDYWSAYQDAKAELSAALEAEVS